jgi:signal transduction histidine kinase
MREQDSSPVLMGEEFLSLVSHEIKSPLTSITGYATFAEDAVRNNDQTMALESLEVVRSEAQRILKLAEDLLDASCVRAGRFTLEMESVDLVEIVRPIVKRHALMSGRRIDLVAPPGCPRIPGDPRRLAQVIENVISNAVKYSPESTPVRITMKHDCSTLRISVSNGGATIPPDKISALFKRFSRLRMDSDGNGRRNGTGLGLFISKQIVDMHGGSIAVASTDEEGTTFTIELPCSAETEN